MGSEIRVIYIHKLRLREVFLAEWKNILKSGLHVYFPRRNQQSVSSTIKLIQKVNGYNIRNNSVEAPRYFNASRSQQSFGPVMLKPFEKYVKSYPIEFERDYERFPGSSCEDQNEGL